MPHYGAALDAVRTNLEAYLRQTAEFDRLLDDPFEGLEVERNIVRLPQAPGLRRDPARQGCGCGRCAVA